MLAGHQPPPRGETSDHIGPGLLRILDRLDDTPAEIVTELSDTLRQSPLGAALTGDASRDSGPDRSFPFRWSTDPAARERYTADPGSDSDDKLQLLAVIGAQSMRTSPPT